MEQLALALDPYPRKPDAEFLGGHLRYFLKQALAHFSAAMIEMNRTVLIDVDQRTGLIEVCERE